MSTGRPHAAPLVISQLKCGRSTGRSHVHNFAQCSCTTCLSMPSPCCQSVYRLSVLLHHSSLHAYMRPVYRPLTRTAFLDAKCGPFTGRPPTTPLLSHICRYRSVYRPLTRAPLEKCREMPSTGRSTVRSHMRHLRKVEHGPVYRPLVRWHHASRDAGSSHLSDAPSTAMSTGCLYVCTILRPCLVSTTSLPSGARLKRTRDGEWRTSTNPGHGPG